MLFFYVILNGVKYLKNCVNGFFLPSAVKMTIWNFQFHFRKFNEFYPIAK